MATTPTPARLSLAGEPRLALASGERVLERRAAALLALVALEPGVTRARAAAWLWPDSAQPRQALRQQLLRFRQLFGHPLVAGDDTLQLADGLSLAYGGEGDGAGDPRAELLQGLAFDDCPEFQTWLDARRLERAGRQSEAHAAALAAAEAAGDLDAALALAERAWRADPASERQARELMRLHWRRGDAGAALAVAAALRDTLRRRFGTAPGPEVQALEQRLREAAQAAALPPPAAGRETPLALLRPPRLLGRAAPLAQLLASVQRRGTAVVEGEAGIGKTRLLDDLARHLEQPVLRAGARPGDRALPHALLVRLLRAALRQLAEPLPPPLAQELARLLPELGEPQRQARAAAQVRLFDAVRALLARAAAAGAGAVLLDDLHHADAASLEALRHAAASGTGLAWVASCRPDEGEAALQPLRQTLAGAPDALQLSLPPLQPADVAALLAELPRWPAGATPPVGLADALCERTGGNPLFLIETLKALWQAAGATPGGTPALPRLQQLPGVAGLIGQRLQRVSPAALALARCAAVAGQDFQAELAVAVLGQRAVDLADAWAELERERIFAGAGFAHELVAEAAALTLPAPVAAALHAAVADALERAVDGRAAPPARIAQHHERAGHAARAAPFWHAAGEAALAALRFAEAAEAFERAALGHGAAGRGDAAFASAYAMRQASFELDLGERSEAALALLERHAGTPLQRAQASNERAVTLLHRGDLAGCDAAAQAGLAALAGAEAPLLRAELRRNVAAVALWRQQTGVALGELRAIEADVERLAGTAQRAEFRQSLAIVLDHDDQAAVAQPEHEKAIALYLAEGMVPAAAQVAANLAVSHFDSGDAATAWAALERARSLLAAVPDAHRSYSSLSLNSGYVLTALGRYGPALEQFEHAVARAREQTPGWLPLVMAWRALLWLHLNQPARAGQDLAAAEPGEATPLLARARWTTVRTQWLHALHGPRPEALAALDALLAQLPPAGRRLTRWRLALARLPHLDDDAAAAAEARALQAELQGHGRVGLEIVAAAECAERLRRLGEAEAAAASARAALNALAQRAPDGVYRGRIWAQCLPALAAVGDTRHAALLEAARAWVEATARQAVPEPFRDGFGRRHPAHRLLLQGP